MKLTQIIIPLDPPADIILEAGVQQEEAIGLAAAQERTLWDNGLPSSFSTSFILARTKQEPLGEIHTDFVKEVSQISVAYALVTRVSCSTGLSIL